jgi:hypothetical protein
MASTLSKGVDEVGNVAVKVIIFILLIGALVSTSVVTAITWVNISAITSNLGTFFTGLVGMFGIIGTILGIVYLVKKWKESSTKGGLEA